MTNTHKIKSRGHDARRSTPRPTSLVRRFSSVLFVLSISVAAGGALAQQFGQGNAPQANLASLDPGPRAGSVGAGNPIQGLSPQQNTFFQNGLQQFNEVESVPRAHV